MWSLDFFKEFSRVPRAPYHEEQAFAYLKNYALKQGYEVVGDAAGNMLVKVAGAGNGKDSAPLAIQAHTDMVCVCEPDHQIDFLTDGIEVYEEGGFLYAKGTTLGADDGIGVALAFYCAQLPNHPPLEILLTVQEEVGMHGAAAVKAGFFQADRLINIDNAHESVLINGCAGGTTLELHLPVIHDHDFVAKEYLKVSVQGLVGGHSGMDIHLGRLSANKVLLDLLLQLDEQGIDYRLVEMKVGMARNAIARDGYVVIALGQVADKAKIRACKSRLISGDQESVTFLLEEIENINHPLLSKMSQEALMTLLQGVEHGVISWANQASGEVKTSNNLATTSYDGKEFVLTVFHRSFDTTELDAVTQRIRELAEQVGATITHLGTTTPWSPKASSHLQSKMKEIYDKLYPDAGLQISTVHAGLECGYWGLLNKEIDMVSLGPNTYDLHSPQERLELASLGRVERWLEEAMKSL